jgi:ABC-type uncharacterized transport system fused permease/ATPase subunit
MCKESINTVLLCLMLVARSALSVVVAITMGHAAGAIVATDWKNFLRQLRKFALIGIPASLVNSGIKYITSILSLRFQRRLTDRLNRNYVRAQHTGPRPTHCVQYRLCISSCYLLWRRCRVHAGDGGQFLQGDRIT